MTGQFPDESLPALFEAVSGEDRIALAVSGGSDSMALLHLALRHARAGGPALHVLTVDHGLREGSAGEAAAVAAFCAGQGVTHETLHWLRPPGDTGNLSSDAREGRYGLMARACAVRGIGTLLTGHTLDDQAETVLMRLGRGSGVDGLAAMRPVTRLWGLRIVRSLLGQTRAPLRAMLAHAGIAWSEDPTNDDRSYARIEARAALAALAPLGITSQRLAETANAMEDARTVLDERATVLAAETCAAMPLGHVILRPAPLSAAPRETAHRLLARLLCAVSGNAYRPRREALAGLLARMAGVGFGGATLHGCRIDPLKDGRIAIQREPQACAASLPATGPGVWDARFDVVLPNPLDGARIAATGEGGLRLLKRAEAPLPPCWTRAPRPARACTPALWRGADLLAIPLAGYHPAPEASECRAAARYPAGITVVDPAREDFI